jgi:hypothetical protein
MTPAAAISREPQASPLAQQGRFTFLVVPNFAKIAAAVCVKLREQGVQN